MIIFKEKTKKKETYIPLTKFEDRVVDFKTFCEGIKVNFKRELTLSFSDSQGESVIVTAGPTDVKITPSEITIQNRNTGLICVLRFNVLDLSSISEVSNASNIDYIFPLAKFRRAYYRVAVK